MRTTPPTLEPPSPRLPSSAPGVFEGATISLSMERGATVLTRPPASAGSPPPSRSGPALALQGAPIETATTAPDEPDFTQRGAVGTLALAPASGDDAGRQDRRQTAKSADLEGADPAHGYEPAARSVYHTKSAGQRHRGPGNRRGEAVGPRPFPIFGRAPSDFRLRTREDGDGAGPLPSASSRKFH